MITSYINLTLGTYLDIDKVLRSEADDIDKQVSIIAILTGNTEEEILALPLTEYSALAAKTDFLKQEAPLVTAPKRVIVGGRAYIPTEDFTKITTAQYVDFQTFSKEGVERLPELLAVLLIPEGHKYGQDYDFAGVVADVKTLPLPVALALVGFFFASWSASIAASLSSLEGMKKKVSKERREQLEKIISQTREMLAGAGLQT